MSKKDNLQQHDLHEKVTLKSDLEGTVRGIYQENKGETFKYLVEYWTPHGSKEEAWYTHKEFKK